MRNIRNALNVRTFKNMLRRPYIKVSVCCALLACVCCVTLFVAIVWVKPPPLLDNVPFSTLIFDRDGNLLRMGLSTDEKFRERVSLADIPFSVRRAALLYEDQHYFSHPGVNVFSFVRALWQNIWGTRRVGASTIAMQVARLHGGLVTNTIGGKLQQMLLALRLIYHYGHDQVLEAYFNLAPYGGNVEGIGAASRVYFQQSVKTLTPVQALALTVVPQNPVKRAFRVAGSGQFKGALSPSEGLEKARERIHVAWNDAYPDNPVPHNPPPLRVYGIKLMPMAAPHLSAELLLQAQNAEAKTHTTRTLHTSIDPEAQDIVERALQSFATRHTPYGITNASAMLVHWPSMEVRALAGSADFFDTSIDGQVDGTRGKRSPGSTLKPFIFALALDQGLIHPQTVLMDSPKSFGDYNPENFDLQFQGPLPAHEALRKSRNVPAIGLASRLDPDLYTLLQRAHVYFPHGVSHYGLSLVLGGAELTMRELVTLYAMLANGGVWRPLRFLHKKNIHEERYDATLSHEITQEKRSEYGLLADTEARSLPLLSPEAALITLSMLEMPSQDLWAVRKGIPLRYKTGTSNGFRDAWTVGIVGPYVLAIWVGNFDNRPHPLFVGNQIAAPLFSHMAQVLTTQQGLTDILAQKFQNTNIIRLEVCRDTGDVNTQMCAQTVKTWFIPGTSPVKDSGIYQKIWVHEDTGLRLCSPHDSGATEQVVEIWPSELYRLFALAGLHKPLPPPFAQPCPDTPDGLSANLGTNLGLTIQSPKEGITYHLTGQEPVQVAADMTPTPYRGDTIPFIASSGADVQELFWFVGETYLGSTSPQDPLFWKPVTGKHTVRVVDDRGMSHSIVVQVAQ